LFASSRARLFIKAAIVATTIVSASSLLAQQQTPPRFTGGTDAILVDVSVTRAGARVEGLTNADFIIKDSGIVQNAQIVAADSFPVSLLLAFDASASVRGEPLNNLKTAAKAAVAALRPNDEAALMTFSHSVTLRAGWTTSREALTKAIDGVTATGLTALNDAAFAALALTSKPGTRRLVLFFTDGDDTSSWTTAAALLQAARRAESVFYNVTLDSARHSVAAISKMLEAPAKPGEHLREDVEQWMTAEPTLYRGAALSLVTMETGGETLHAADGPKLSAAFVDIVSRFTHRYVLAYTPTGVPATGWHPLTVEVKGGGEVSARRGYAR
jgi:VWFA-related protein